MKWLLILVSVLVLIGGVLFSGVIQNKLMFHPSTIDSVSDMPEHTEVHFNGLHGLLFKTPESRKIILHCHGNAGNISNRGEIYKFLISAGANVFAFDYSGYGKSKGTPSEQQLYRDAESAYQQLIKLDYRPARHYHMWRINRWWGSDMVGLPTKMWRVGASVNICTNCGPGSADITSILWSISSRLKR